MSREIAIAVVLMSTVAIGLIDYVTGPNIGFSLFYLVPIAVAGWRLGQPHASIAATAAALIWVAADIAASRDLAVGVSAWNGFTRLVIFNALAVLLVRTRREREHHLALNAMREQLLYSVAHELRAPLAVLENALDILGEGYADLPADEFAKITGSAQRTAGRLRTLMEDLLSAGSIQAGRFHVDPQPVELQRIVSDAKITGSAQRTAGRLRTLMETLLSAGSIQAGRFHVDPQPVELQRIVSDAMDSVELLILERGQRVDVRGPGIPKEEQRLLFERFYRPRVEGPGIGLGLAIAKGIVEAHGGHIGIDSEPGRGTSVWFTLPEAT